LVSRRTAGRAFNESVSCSPSGFRAVIAIGALAALSLIATACAATDEETGATGYLYAGSGDGT